MMLEPLLSKPSDCSLHVLVRNRTYPQIMTVFDNYLNDKNNNRKQMLIKWSITPNDDQELAVDVLGSQLSQEEKEKITEILFSWMLEGTQQHLDKPTDLTYFTSEDDELLLNLKLAQEAICHTRQVLKFSSTHPKANDLNWPEFHKLETQINDIRSKTKRDQYLFFYRYSDFNEVNRISNHQMIQYHLNARCLIDSDRATQIFIQTAQFWARTFKMGNCEEFANEVFHYAVNLGVNLSRQVSVSRFKKNDHAFNLIGEGKSMVFCDAWAGVFFPYQANQQALGNFRQFFYKEKRFNLIIQSHKSDNEIAAILKGNVELVHASAKYLQVNLTDPLHAFINKLVESSVAKEKYLYLMVIKPNLKDAITQGLLTLDEVRGWVNPKEILETYFVEPGVLLPLLICQYQHNPDFLFEFIKYHGFGTIDKTIDNHLNALFYCIKQNLISIAEFLLQNGADPNFELICDGVLLSPLCLAIALNHMMCVNLLLFYQADLNKSGQLNPLLVAMLYDRSSVLNLLLKQNVINLALPLTLTIETWSLLFKNHSLSSEQNFALCLADKTKSVASTRTNLADHLALSFFDVANITGHKNLAAKLVSPIFLSPHANKNEVVEVRQFNRHSRT